MVCYEKLTYVLRWKILEELNSGVLSIWLPHIQYLISAFAWLPFVVRYRRISEFQFLRCFIWIFVRKMWIFLRIFQSESNDDLYRVHPPHSRIGYDTIISRKKCKNWLLNSEVAHFLENLNLFLLMLGLEWQIVQQIKWFLNLFIILSAGVWKTMKSNVLNNKIWNKENFAIWKFVGT